MAYCTADDLKSFGYTIQDSDTANLTLMCEMASRSVDAYCCQTFDAKTGAVESHIVRVKGGLLYVFPKNLTVNNIQSITFSTIAGQNISATIENATYLESKACIIATTNAEDGEYFVTLVYDYGYSSGSFPADLVKATVLMALPMLDDYFLAQESNVTMVKSIKQGELKIDRIDTSQAPKNALDILNGGNGGLGYVRVRAAS